MTEITDLEIAARLIGSEIEWCNENPDKAFTAEYRKGFVNGLIQARYIIGELKRQPQANEQRPSPPADIGA